ncbi:MAG: hypothetical protein U1F43_27285 [Myxococcota bacterium]
MPARSLVYPSCIMAFSALGLGVGACGDDAGGSDAGADTTIAETTVADTIAVDDATGDTTVADTTVVDTTVADTTVADTTVADTTVADTTVADGADPAAGTCGCGSTSSCLQATTAEACATLTSTCGGGGLARVDACATDDVMASCERSNTINYRYWARIEGWLANAAADCASTVAGPAGLFSVAAIPAGEGEVCSCQRTAAACVEIHGAGCAALTCEAPEGVQAAACTATGRLPDRCVTRDGQRELVFYSAAVSAATAESSCLGASATEYFWFPADLLP